MKNSLVVLIDLDDVMCEFVDGLCRWLHSKHNTNVLATDIKGWNLKQYFPTLSEDDIWEPTHTREFWDTVNVKEGAVKYIKALIDDGHQVYICTATDYRAIKPKFDLVIKKYFPYITWSQIIVTKNKSMINGDVLIDDGIHNLESTKFKKILMSAPHNEYYNAEINGMTRVRTWKEAYDAVCEYASNLPKENNINDSN